jgi:hypothetical protein
VKWRDFPPLGEFVLYCEESESAGRGHLDRSLRLARFLRRLGFSVSLNVSLCSSVAVDEILAGGEINVQRGAPRSGHIAVIDAFSPGMIACAMSLSKEASRVVYIYDHGDVIFGCDYLVHPLPIDLSKFARADLEIEQIAGWDALFLEPTNQVSAYSVARRCFSIVRSPCRVLISFGSIDSKSYSHALVDRLSVMNPSIDIVVIQGKYFSCTHIKKLILLEENRPNVKRIPWVPDLVNFASNFDLVFCGGGQTPLELVAGGVNVWIIQMAVSQSAQVEFIGEQLMLRHDKLEELREIRFSLVFRFILAGRYILSSLLFRLRAS